MRNANETCLSLKIRALLHPPFLSSSVFLLSGEPLGYAVYIFVCVTIFLYIIQHKNSVMIKGLVPMEYPDTTQELSISASNREIGVSTPIVLSADQGPDMQDRLTEVSNI